MEPIFKPPGGSPIDKSELELTLTGKRMFIKTVPAKTSPLHYTKWEKLARHTNQADPFCCTPVWQLAFHTAFSPKRALFIKEEQNCVLAFAEKIFSPDNIILTPIEPHWLFGNPLLGNDSVRLLYDTLSFFEKTYKPYFPRIAISGIRPRGTFFRQVKKVFGQRFDFTYHSSNTQCAASLAGGIDGYLSRRSNDQRRNLKRSSKRASDSGIVFERMHQENGQDHERVYSRMLAVEAASWKGIGKCGMAEEPAKQFYGTMLKWLFLSSNARVIFAKHDGTDIGFIFGGMAENIYRGQQFSYDEKWRSYSIGNILQLEQIKWLCEENAIRYDMGPLAGPRMDYKAHWTEKQFELETWILSKK